MLVNLGYLTTISTTRPISFSLLKYTITVKHESVEKDVIVVSSCVTVHYICREKSKKNVDPYLGIGETRGRDRPSTLFS